ncbi:hypothetical protein F9K80_23660, partial [Brucella intermedia]
HQIDPAYLPQTVSYSGKEKPGTIVIDTGKRFLYLVQSDGKAMLVLTMETAIAASDPIKRR